MKRTMSTIAVLLAMWAIHQTRADGMPENLQKQINDAFIGEWGVTIEYDGMMSTGKLNVSWATGKHVAIMQDEMQGALSGQNAGLVGWEGDTKTLVHRGFLSSGDHFTIRYTRFSEKEWSGSITGVQGGKPYESRASVIWKGDSFEYRDTMHGKPFLYTGKRRR